MNSAGSHFLEKYQTGPTQIFGEEWAIASMTSTLVTNHCCAEAFTPSATAGGIYQAAMSFFRRIFTISEMNLKVYPKDSCHSLTRRKATSHTPTTLISMTLLDGLRTEDGGET